MNDATHRSRSQARSGTVSYSQPVTIKKTRDCEVQLLLHYIPHKTRDDELSAKFIYSKRGDQGYRIGTPVSFSLREDEIQELLVHLKDGLALAAEGTDGEYIVIRLDETPTDIEGRDPHKVGAAIRSLLQQSSFVEKVLLNDQGAELIRAMQASLRVAEMTHAVEKLRRFLHGGVVDERSYQVWCEEHSWAFGNAYAIRDDVRNIALGDQVDALLALTANGLRDILELKRPDMDPLRWDADHRSYYWSPDAAEAIGQCNRYLDALHEAARTGLRDHPEVVAFHPRALIVIGRSEGWSDDKLRALHGLNNRLHGIQIITFDQLLAQAERLLDVLTDAAA